MNRAEEISNIETDDLLTSGPRSVREGPSTRPFVDPRLKNVTRIPLTFRSSAERMIKCVDDQHAKASGFSQVTLQKFWAGTVLARILWIGVRFGPVSRRPIMIESVVAVAP
ncbi:hypothetical protein Areg01_71860 [Actinoplanes regularis]|nr:hypothetical protein Areg01_71860 [Actinoplanes regularis]